MNIVIDIKQFVNSPDASDIEYKLYVTDDIEEMSKLRDEGHYVVPIINEATKDVDLSDYKYVVMNPEEVDTDYYIKIWQRYAGIPWKILETDCYLVREMTEHDVEALYEIYEDDSITDYTEALFPEYEDELEYTRNYMENVYSYFGFGTWVIVDKKEDRLIGRAGFNYREGVKEPELGYVIAKRKQNMGVASEVCRAILIYGFEELGFESVCAFSASENIPSVKLLEKLGFAEDPDGDRVILESKGNIYNLIKYVKNR